MTTNMELAGRVARHAELESVALRGATVSTGIERSSMPEEVSVALEYRSVIHRLGPGDSGEREVCVAVDFRFNAKSDNEESDESVEVLSLEAGYHLTYALNPQAEIGEECFKHFAEVNGPYNAWPYWRELVQSVCGRIGIPAFTVPVYRPRAVEISGEAASAQREP